MSSVDCLELQPFTLLEASKLKDVMSCIKIDLNQLLQPKLHAYFVEQYSNQRFAISLQKVKWHLEDKQFYVWLALQYCFKHHQNEPIPSYQALSEIGKKMHLKEQTLVKKWINLLRSQAKIHVWTNEEEQIVLSLQNEPQFKNNWTSISMYLGQQGFRLLHPKDIRERWNNYIDPKIHKDEWQVEEDFTLISNVKVIGLCWSSLSMRIRGRNENQIKNRYHQLMKKYRTVKKCSEKVSELYNKQLLTIKGSAHNQPTSNQLEQEESGQNQQEPPDLVTIQILKTYPYLQELPIEQGGSPLYAKEPSLNEQLSNISNNEQFNTFAKLQKKRFRDFTSNFKSIESNNRSKSNNSNNHHSSGSSHHFNQSIDQQLEVGHIVRDLFSQSQLYQYLRDDDAPMHSQEDVNQISPMHPFDDMIV